MLHSFRIHLLDFFFVGSVGHYLKEHKNNQGCGPTRIANNLSATGVDEHCCLLVVVAAPSLPIICTLPPETSVEVAPGDIVRLQRSGPLSISFLMPSRCDEEKRQPLGHLMEAKNAKTLM